MSLGEAIRAIEAYRDMRKDRAYLDYMHAMTTGMFIGSMFGSRQPPKIEDIYPYLFPKDDEAIEEALEEQRMTQSEINFINFANSFNKRYEAHGNGKPESENNG